MSGQRGKQPAFWGAVAGTAILAPVVLNLAADRLGHLPGFGGLRTLNDYTTRRNG
jgi:hypothetical protein